MTSRPEAKRAASETMARQSVPAPAGTGNTVIIFTTLSGHLYRGEQLCTDALHTILNGVVAMLDTGDPICLTNPANSKEDICEKWQKNHDSFTAFAQAIREFRARWERLLDMRGLDDIATELRCF